MEVLLEKITQHAMNYAIRSGIAITSGYALQQCTRLIKTVDGNERNEIALLQSRLESKIRIISPAIDMIELIAARGNTSLDSAIVLTKSIRFEIQSLGIKLSKTLASNCDTNQKATPVTVVQLNAIISDLKALTNQIEDAVPLINLAITTSGVNLSTSLPQTVSPSRLLQASTFLSAGDSAFVYEQCKPTQIGPNFVLSLYMLFEGHANAIVDHEKAREATWQEVIHKAKVKLIRVPIKDLNHLPGTGLDPLRTSTLGQKNAETGNFFPKDIPSDDRAHEFAYQLLLIEDLDDDRFHSFEVDDVKPTAYDDVNLAGIREFIPVHEISKIFYADTGKILNIGSDGEPNNPVLLIKRDSSADPPRRMIDNIEFSREDDFELPEEIEQRQEEDLEEAEIDHSSAQLLRESSITNDQPTLQAWRFPAGLDPEWMAFEVYTEPIETDSESDIDIEEQSPTLQRKTLTSTFARLSLRQSSQSSPPAPPPTQQSPTSPPPTHRIPSGPQLPHIKTSLSLLELLIRLTALQQFQQASHLSISDDLLTFFLSESASTGAGADAHRRKILRESARRRVGFDPYDESPLHTHRRSNATPPAAAAATPAMATAAESNARGPSASVRSRIERWDAGDVPSSPVSAWGGREDGDGDGDGDDDDDRVRGGSGSGFTHSSSPLAGRGREAAVLGGGEDRSRRMVNRTQALRRQLGSEARKGSGLVKSSSDSTLGTSPAGKGE